MSQCDRVMQWLLEDSDLGLDAGEQDHGCTEHLRTCERCRTLADRISGAERELGRFLDAQSSRTSVEDALQRAVKEARARQRRRGWRVAIPLATAAGLAALILSPGSSPNSPEALDVLTLSVNHPVEVETPADRSVAVFETSDPDIVVVWFY